jgi:hypothetical protein
LELGCIYVAMVQQHNSLTLVLKQLFFSSLSLSPFPQVGVVASGPKQIREAINKLNLKNTKVDLSNGYIDAQKCANNGVMVVVVGQLSVPGSPAKPFVQSFVLSCQVMKT